MENMPSHYRGDEKTENQRREWSDRRAHHLYSIASTSKDGDLRREALMFLAALERAGIKDAKWAMDSIKKQSKEENETTLS
jgi:predicted AAA+ superfamily ATPase